MFEYQAEAITRKSFNFESEAFSLSSPCFDHPDVDENGEWNIPEDIFNHISISRDMSPTEVWDVVAAYMW